MVLQKLRLVFRIILFFCLWCNSLTYAQLNEFKENKARLDNDRQLLAKNKIKQQDKYAIRLKNHQPAGDSTLFYQYFLDGKGNYIRSQWFTQNTFTGEVS